MATVTLWLITISSDQPIHDIATCLSAEGLTVREVLEEIGCITGAADDATVQRLKRVQGVVDIAPDTPMDVGPPGTDETW
ncbi:MAG: hypothetical protein P3W96_013340 [Halomonas sp.]|nr:hypothetical protein [Halomonas sp.]MDM7482972.1 hypothetical protein [Halomonas sp.]